MVDSQTCCICIGPLTLDTEIVTTSCQHSFHKGCLEPWGNMTNSCPSCRAPLDASRPIQPLPLGEEEEAELSQIAIFRLLQQALGHMVRLDADDDEVVIFPVFGFPDGEEEEEEDDLEGKSQCANCFCLYSQETGVSCRYCEENKYCSITCRNLHRRSHRRRCSRRFQRCSGCHTFFIRDEVIACGTCQGPRERYFCREQCFTAHHNMCQQPVVEDCVAQPQGDDDGEGAKRRRVT